MQQLSGTWDAAARTEVEAAMLGTQGPHARRAWERTATELDAYAVAWAAMHTQACEATNVGQQQSSASWTFVWPVCTARR
ncbi:MAG: hypothetical protein JKY37_33745 [Nannocystaceae bacterium]|nr:hypothetical protein [Nannocystaceae bacterium]